MQKRKTYSPLSNNLLHTNSTWPYVAGGGGAFSTPTDQTSNLAHPTTNQDCTDQTAAGGAGEILAKPSPPDAVRRKSAKTARFGQKNEGKLGQEKLASDIPQIDKPPTVPSRNANNLARGGGVIPPFGGTENPSTKPRLHRPNCGRRRWKNFCKILING